jgi:hypothetical protein
MWCVGAYFLLRLIFIIREEKKAAAWGKPVIGFIFAMIFGLCLALVSIWPTQDYVRNYSPRAAEGRGFEYAASWSLHAEEAISQIVPGFAGYSTLGNHPTLSSDQTYWGKNYFKINSEYAGLAALILGIIGLFIYRDRYSYFFLAVAIFSLLYALGKAGLIFHLFYSIVPFVSKFRAPSTIMFLFCFAVMFLGARTLDHIEKNKKVPRLKTILIMLLIIGGIYLVKGLVIAASGMGLMRIYTSILHPRIEPGQLGFLEANLPNIAGGLLLGAFLLTSTAGLLWTYSNRKTSFQTMATIFIGLVLIDSWIINDRKFIRTVDPDPFFSKPAAAAFLERQPSPFRAMALPQTLSNQNLLAQFGIEQVAGYHGNQLRWFDNFIGGSNQANAGSPLVLSLANSEFILARQKVNSPVLESVSSVAGAEIYRYIDALPRGRIVYDYEVIADPEAALKRLFEPGFDFKNKIIIGREPSTPVIPPTSVAADSVVFLPAPPDRIRVKATLANSGFLAIQDNWYPYWRARIGDAVIPVYRTDYTFMAVQLPPGRHEIEFKIENPKYILGKNVTLISWALLVAGLIIGAISWKRRRPAAEA